MLGKIVGWILLVFTIRKYSYCSTSYNYYRDFTGLLALYLRIFLIWKLLKFWFTNNYYDNSDKKMEKVLIIEKLPFFSSQNTYTHFFNLLHRGYHFTPSSLSSLDRIILLVHYKTWLFNCLGNWWLLSFPPCVAVFVIHKSSLRQTNKGVAWLYTLSSIYAVYNRLGGLSSFLLILPALILTPPFHS